METPNSKRDCDHLSPDQRSPPIKFIRRHLRDIMRDTNEQVETLKEEVATMKELKVELEYVKKRISN